MLELPMPEMVIFVSVGILCLAAAIIGIVQLQSGGEKYRHLLLPIVSLVICLEAVILIFRAIAIQAIPLTGLFESMIVLTIVFGLIFLFFSIAIQQVWFGSVMVWVILTMILLTGTVAKPASEPHAVAATPWAIAHGTAMILSGASTMFAMACACLYLLGRGNLKRKKVMQVLGRVPNIEKLERMNLFGLQVCFVLMTFGLVSGIGMAAVSSARLEISAFEWLTDAKIVLITAVWVLLGVILALRRMFTVKGKTIVYMTTIAFVLILFALVGTTVFCGTRHNFVKEDVKAVEIRR